MKKLYIRFFKDKESQIPIDSRSLLKDYLVSYTTLNDLCITSEIADWMAEFPNGKVDFVFLD